MARVVAKKYLIGMRANTLKTLAGMSMLNSKLECDLHEDVLPWLMAEKEKFTHYSDEAVRMSELLID